MLGGTLDTVNALGFPVACLYVLEDDAPRYRLARSRGLPETSGAEVKAMGVGLPGRVLSMGETQVAHGDDEALLPLKAGGARSAVACPVWIDGWLAGVLLAGSGINTPPEEELVSALELIAGHTGLELSNVGRHEQQRQLLEHLEEVNRLKNDFLTTASHELRTPLTALQGIAATLQDSWDLVDEPTRRALLQSMRTKTTTLEHAIVSMLEFSQVMEDPSGLERARCDLTELLGWIPERIRDRVSDHVLSSDVAAGLIVRADGSLIGRVVEHLLANATTHTPAGTTVILSAALRDGEVEVAVADDGPGISPEDMAMMGERFYRGGDLNARPPGGLGLGLALAQEILELHGSELEVRSAPGEGARFSFRLLPLTPDAAPAESEEVCEVVR